MMYTECVIIMIIMTLYIPDLVLGNFSTITAFLNTANAPILLLTASIASCITAPESIIGCSGVGSLSTSRPRGTWPR